MAHCGLIIKGGSRNESEEEQGLAHFIEHVIFKGTSKRKAYHILSRMEDVGGELNADELKAKLITVNGQRSQTAISVLGNIKLIDNDILGVQHFQINDPGPDGQITWAGTASRIFVSPLDDANTDQIVDRVRTGCARSFESFL